MKNLWIGINGVRFVNLAHASRIEISGGGDGYVVNALMHTGGEISDHWIRLRVFATAVEAQEWVCDILNDEDNREWEIYAGSGDSK